MAVEPYKISIPDSALERLQQKLSLATLPDELDDTGWDMGAPLADIKRLVAHWQTNYSWRKTEARLNKLPHYQTPIQCTGFAPLSIHFIHVRSTRPSAVPLLFIHGWPGSFLEALSLISPLTNPSSSSSPAFHLIIPSLPNHAFSSSTPTRGFGLRQYAETLHKLMQRLNYPTYATQAGDWGFHISRTLGLLYPSSCRVSHLNVAEAYPPSLTTHPLLAIQHALTPYTAHEAAGVARTKVHEAEGRGYEVIANTKPQTVGYGLADSAVGLLGWIYEKLALWSGEGYVWTDDEVLDWVCLYWFSEAGPAASLRIYYEVAHAETAFRGAHEGEARNDVGYERCLRWIPHVKYGISHQPGDIIDVPDSWAATLGDVVLQTRNEKGGHFAAVEQPQIIVRDLRAMFSAGGQCEGLVPAV